MGGLVIGITGLQSGASPSAGIGVARCLRLAGDDSIKLVALEYEPLAAGFYLSDLFDWAFLTPPPSMPSLLLEKLVEVKAQTSLSCLIPNLDVEQEIYGAFQARLKAYGIHTLVATPSAVHKRSKLALGALADEHGFRVPRTEPVQCWEDVTRVLQDADFPLIVKGHFCDAYLVRSSEEALVFIAKLCAVWGWPVLIQEFVRGAEYCVAGLADHSSELIGAVAMMKFGLTEKGKAWSGVTVGEPHLLDLTRRFIQALRWAGPLEIDFIRCEETGQFYIIDVNPRFPAWIYLAAIAGQNLPLLAVYAALGKHVRKEETYRTGLLFARYAVDMTFDVSQLSKLIMEQEEFL